MTRDEHVAGVTGLKTKKDCECVTMRGHRSIIEMLMHLKKKNRILITSHEPIDTKIDNMSVQSYTVCPDNGQRIMEHSVA